MVEALTELFQDATTDSSVRVVLLSGVGPAFCAGADVNELAAEDRARALDFVRRGAALVELVTELGKPVVAAIGGHALGGGMELALGCTVRVASERASFGLPEVRLGIMPGWGGTQRLARLCGPSRSALLALTGESIDASTAQAWGLVDRVVTHSALCDTALQICRELAGARPEARAAITQALRATTENTLADGLRREAELFGELFLHPATRDTVAGYVRPRHSRDRE